MHRRAEQVARFVASLLAVVALIGIVPLGLIAVTRHRFASSNPLHEIGWPWQWSVGAVIDTVRSPLTDDAVVNLLIRLAVVTVWVSLGVIVVTTGFEIAHLIRHRGMTMPSVRGLGWAQPFARTLAAGLVVLLPLTTPQASLATDGERGASMPAVADSESSAGSTALAGAQVDRRTISPTHAPAARAPTLHIVQRGESIYGIAEQLAGETAMSIADVADSILDANLGTTMVGGQQFTNPAYIEVGWELVIPADVLPPVRAAPTARATRPSDLDHTPPTETADENSAEAGSRHLVVRGDTLSAIAAEHLGDPDAWPVVFDANAGRDMGDGRTFSDPHLIVAGWSIDIPQVDALPVEPQIEAPRTGGDPLFVDHPDASVDPGASATHSSTTAPEDLDAETETDIRVSADGNIGAQGETTGVQHAADVETDTDTDTDAPAVGDAPAWSQPDAATPDGSDRPLAAPNPSPRPALDQSESRPPATPPSADPSAPAAPTSTTTPLVPDGPATADDNGRSRPSAPTPIRVEHAALLAAGVLALVGVRRRRRLRSASTRARVPEPPAAVMATERRLRSIDPGERSTRVDVAIRAVAHELVDTDVQIGVVLLGPDGDIEIRLTGPARLSAPWHGDDQSWFLPASVPVEILGEAARRVGTPCVALVQLGVAERRDVLLDLEACGTLAVEATQTQADDVVTAIASGLATSPYAEIAHVISVSLPRAAVFGHRNAHHAPAPDAAIELAHTLVGRVRPDDRSTFSLRSLRTGGEMWEPAIVLVGTQDPGQDRVLSAPLPAAGRGIGLVIAADANDLVAAPARLIGRPDGWKLNAFGQSLELTPVGVTANELADIAAMIEDATAPLLTEELNWAATESAPAHADTYPTAHTAHAGLAHDEPEPGQPEHHEDKHTEREHSEHEHAASEPAEQPAQASSAGLATPAEHRDREPTEHAHTEPVQSEHTEHALSPEHDHARANNDTTAAAHDPDGVDRFTARHHAIVVRLMGGVDVVSSDGERGVFERSKTVELIAWLATHRTSSTRSAARTALWELDVRDATFANVVSEARRGLARLVTPPGDDEWVARTLTEQLPLHDGVTTDVALMEERLAAARLQPPTQAIATLRPAAELIRDMPFAGTSYLWPDAEGLTSNLVLLAISVTTELAGHALSLGDTDLVFWATGQGLKVLAGHEELIGLRMRAHARAGDLAGVRQEWESYERVIVADAWSDGEPAPKLLTLRRELLTAPT